MKPSRFARVLCLAAALSLLPLGISAAWAGVKASASNPSRTTVTAGSFRMAAVANTASTTFLSSGYSFTYTSGTVSYYVVKNFGTLAIKSLTLSQTVALAQRYCVNQAFKTNSATTCANNAAATTFGSGVTTATAVTLSSNIAAGGYLTIAEQSGGNGTDVVSITTKRTDAVTNGTVTG